MILLCLHTRAAVLESGTLQGLHDVHREGLVAEIYGISALRIHTLV